MFSAITQIKNNKFGAHFPFGMGYGGAGEGFMFAGVPSNCILTVRWPSQTEFVVVAKCHASGRPSAWMPDDSVHLIFMHTII